MSERVSNVARILESRFEHKTSRLSITTFHGSASAEQLDKCCDLLGWKWMIPEDG